MTCIYIMNNYIETNNVDKSCNHSYPKDINTGILIIQYYLINMIKDNVFYQFQENMEHLVIRQPGMVWVLNIKDNGVHSDKLLDNVFLKREGYIIF